MDSLRKLNASDPVKAKEIGEAFKKEFNVPKVVGNITEARHGEFLALAISKAEESL